MIDREMAGRVRTEQDRLVARYVNEHVYPYSNFYRPRLERARLGNGQIKGVADLSRLPFTEATEITDATQLVLRPDPDGIGRSSSTRLALRLAFARTTGRLDKLNHELLEPDYKPIHWLYENGAPIGYSAHDLERLAELGRQWLESAGLSPYDALVSIVPPGPHLGFWQLSLGARRGGVPSLFLPSTAPSDDIVHLDPTVLAGTPADLIGVLTELEDDGATLEHVKTALVVGDLLDEESRRRLIGLLPPRAVVVSAFAPAGVRSLWVECRGGVGFHTSTDADLVEIVDPSGMAVRAGSDGELVYSSLGWKGTAVLRLRTGLHGRLIPGACPGCGRTSPRLRLAKALPRFAAVLEAHPEVVAWQAELRTVDGVEELLVYLTPSGSGHPGKLLRELDRELRVTQFVVLDLDDLDQRLSDSNDVKVLDLRR
ncbi:MAG TPA: hypothetical protein VMY34_09020 [Acidimicrobiales bacterium]|nr:hypothetical protein [Acidimicrobiales bacterium]